jgi:hypothetical protein
MVHAPDPDLTAIVVCRDDEERVGHVVRRVAGHVESLGLHAEILAVDEDSSDNTLALLALLRHQIPSLRVIPGVAAGRGFVKGVRQARGQALLLIDARCEAPLSALGFALNRLAQGWDGIAVGGRYLVLRRTRILDTLDALVHRRDAVDIQRRFLRRARALALKVELAAARPRSSTWRRLRDTVLLPLASRAWF